MSVYLVALAFLTALAGIQAMIIREDLREEWQTFKLKYEKTYNNEIEEKFRKMIFKENWNMIARHNTKYEKGDVSFSMAMNGFGDLLHHEFVATVNGFKRNNDEGDSSNTTLFILPENVEVPKSINWVKKGYVTEVKNQGGCGSCWSFSATGALEGQHKRKSGKLVDLSEQNLIDCSGKYGNEGCEGGLPSAAFTYIKANKGVDTEESYPYEGVDGKCRFKRKNVGATDTGYVDVKSGNERKLKEAVGTVGPVAVAIDASHPSLEFYSKGIYDEPDCSSQELDHAVLAVGYGNYKGKDYWLVKNSWGADWGENGYVRMSRNKKNQCGIATEANYPLV